MFKAHSRCADTEAEHYLERRLEILIPMTTG